MIKATTPQFQIKIDDADAVEFSKIEVVEVAVRQGAVCIVKQGDDVKIDAEKRTISITLSQSETIKFLSGKPAELQIRIKDKNGIVYSHPPLAVNVIKSLSEEVL